jgi:CheY-like chemotaxis protein
MIAAQRGRCQRSRATVVIRGAEVPPRGGNMERVLIVNDDPAFLEALSGMLRIRVPQTSVDIETDPSVAIQNLTSKGYDLVIADVKMPGTDGFSFVRAAKEVCPNTVAIILTGHGESDLDHKAEEAGADLFLRKPVDRDTFLKSVQAALAVRSGSGSVKQLGTQFERPRPAL